MRRNLETPVEPWQELLQRPVGFPYATGPGQAEFSCQPVLEGARRSLHTPLGLGRMGDNHLDTQFLHCPAELGRHPREVGARRVFEDPVPVGVEGDGYATAPEQTLDQHEVATVVDVKASQRMDPSAGRFSRWR